MVSENAEILKGENMKKFTRFLSTLLVVLMLVTLMPMALAEDAEATQPGVSGDTIQSIIDSLSGFEIPRYVVYCKLSTKLPASNAEVTLTNQLTGKSQTYTANALGIALVPKDKLGIYSVSATCIGSLTGLKYSTVAGINWTFSDKIDFETIMLYPVLNIGLNYSDHFSYMIGYNDGTVRPNATITRAEAASMIFRLLTEDSRKEIFTKSNSFSDVNASNPHNNAISSLTAAGIINGFSDGTFRPNAPITREQFSALIGRMFSVEYTGEASFGDLNGGFADDYINLLAALGIIKGDVDGNFNPNDNITRAQAATILNRLLGRQPASDSANGCSGVKTWTDCPKSMWCYADILEATNSHYYNWATDAGEVIGSDNMIHEVWTKLRNDTPNWADLQK